MFSRKEEECIAQSQAAKIAFIKSKTFDNPLEEYDVT
jgi:hypothetical protein